MLIAFKTTEQRISLWIKAINARYYDYLRKKSTLTIKWEEHENYQLKEKSEKIIITVIENEEKLFVITIFTTTERIQIQGSYYKHWANFEFPLLRSFYQTQQRNINK